MSNPLIKIDKAALNRWMDKAGKGVAGLAEASGVSPRTIRNWLSGRVPQAQAGTLSRVSAVLGCTVTDLGTPTFALDLEDYKFVDYSSAEEKETTLRLDLHMVVRLATLGHWDAAKHIYQSVGERLLVQEQSWYAEVYEVDSKSAYDYQTIHEYGILHESTLILASIKPGEVLTYKRPEGQKFAGRRDVFGGHFETLDPSASHCAHREILSEAMVKKDGVYLLWDAPVLIGKERQFASTARDNNELSSLFAIKVRDRPCLALENVIARDDSELGKVVKAFNIQSTTIEELKSMYNDGADGLQRVVDGLHTPEIRAQVEKAIH